MADFGTICPILGPCPNCSMLELANKITFPETPPPSRRKGRGEMDQRRIRIARWRVPAVRKARTLTCCFRPSAEAFPVLRSRSHPNVFGGDTFDPQRGKIPAVTARRLLRICSPKQPQMRKRARRLRACSERSQPAHSAVVDLLRTLRRCRSRGK